MTQEDRLINLNRIGIGTVQWSEKDYGISSKARKFDINIIKKTIKLAKLNNIDTYDTAYSYNNAEKILGNCITHENVKIVTKTSKYKDTENITSVAFSPCGKFICGNRTRDIIIWKFVTESDNKLSLSKVIEGYYINHMEKDRLKGIGEWQSRFREIQEKNNHIGKVNSVDWSPCGNYVISGSEDHTIKIWHH